MPVQPFTIKPYGSDAIIHTDSERRICRVVDGSVKRGMWLLCVGVWVRARPSERTNGAEDARSHDDGPAKQRMHFDRLRVWLVCEIVAGYVQLCGKKLTLACVSRCFTECCRLCVSYSLYRTMWMANNNNNLDDDQRRNRYIAAAATATFPHHLGLLVLGCWNTCAARSSSLHKCN